MIETAVTTLAQHAVEAAIDAAGSAKEHAVETAKDVAGSAKEAAQDRMQQRSRRKKPRARRMPKMTTWLLVLAGAGFVAWFVARKRQSSSDIVPDTFGDAVERERRAGVVATPGA